MSADATRSSRPSRRGLPAKREAIMDAALGLFVRQGYAATTLDEIATATPVSRQTVYNHFGDKETLFRAVVDAHLAATLDVLREASSGLHGPLPDAETCLHDLARRLIAIAGNPRAASLRRLLQAEGERQPELLALWRDQVAAPVFAEVTGLLARLAHGGALHLDDPVRAAGQFIALVWGTGWQLTSLGTVAGAASADPDERELDVALRSCVRLFVRGYGQP
ncbi:MULTISPECIES: TetR/AcrR family transcriptional regulator [Frankia]|uniref:Transcriptional regulator n=1 Tax=Frankia alni (strain DSM 45986 / CECT 9034 / ACN14a) TaxID=326424 RepID=Q0RMY7_FRAAA|nr:MULTISPECIES: TetR/AcrR family transcriptional regulator [Frankia]CAJ61109.1 putative transcriptional regulator [Frankia alni ACN14a]